MNKKETIGMYGGSFNPLHNGHIKCIRKALTICDKLYIIVGSLPNRDIVSFEEKQNWFKITFKNDMDKITFIWVKDETKDKRNYNLNSWKDDAEKIKSIISKNIDYIFCGSDYNKPNNPYEICYPESKIIFFNREDGINSTMIRNDLEKYKEWLPEIVYSTLKKYQ